MRKVAFSVGCREVVMRFLYTFLLYLLWPFALALLAWRGRRGPGALQHVWERFGYYAAAPDAPLIWLHAVSVGETRAAEPLVRALQARHPQCRILLTHMTATGRETGETLFGGRVMRCYIPFDFPGAAARFLDHFRPRAGIVMETEIWPNLLRAAGERSLPLYLVNARLSEKSFASYRRFAGLVRASLAAFTAVAAQSGEDARRLTALGARDVRVAGNLKFDVTPPPDQLELGRTLRQGFGTARPILLAASTREREEALLLDALEGIAVPGLLIVIVPRHPQRFEEVARLLESRGIRFERRSANAAAAPETRAILGDSMGEMFAYYAACDVAFIGGSLVPLGGQNLIEACAAGIPVLIGPSSYNFAEAAALAIEAGAAIQVPHPEALAREAERLLRDTSAAGRMSEAALAFANAHRGATARVLELIRLRDH
jgi:3-deoxy-D-manno-octulosonic-acid transferase